MMTFEKQNVIKKSVDNLYKKALKQWGENAQVNMIIEEAAELAEAASRLIIAINKMYRANSKTVNMKKMLLEEEIADLQIMLEQACYIFDGKEIARVKRRKLNRLKELLYEKR